MMAMLSVRWIPMVGMEVVQKMEMIVKMETIQLSYSTRDCDGLINTGGSLPVNEIDNDGDNFVECDFHNEGWDGDSGVTGDNDCDDGDNTFILATEICDGQVNECGKSAFKWDW